MAAKRNSGTRPEMIHCEYCGEDYASSYKHCPFCDEMEPEDAYDDDRPARPRGGKRLAGSNTRGGGYGGGPSPLKILGTVISLALIIAAVIIVISIIKPLVDRGKTTLPENSPGVQTSQTPEPSGTPDPEQTPGADQTPGPDDTPAPTGAVEPAPSPSIPVGQTATGFTLNKSEFSLSDRYPDPITLKVTFIPAGSTGNITWTSSDPDAVQVDANGKVSPGSKKGSATITATMAGGVTQTCKVYNSVTGGSAAPSTASPSASSSLSLNRTDFTLDPGQFFRMQVSGTSSTPSWSIGNSSVATVDSDGTVRYAGSGHTTLTCTVDGQTLTCIVRCN